MKVSPFKGKNLYWTIGFVGLLVIWMLWAVGCAKQEQFGDVVGSCPKDAANSIALANASMLNGKVIEIESDSDSMGMAISQNAYVVVVDDWKHVDVGQVIAFLDAEGDLIIHMVTIKKPEAVYTQGINNNYTDVGYVSRKNYVGTMIAQIYHQ